MRDLRQPISTLQPNISICRANALASYRVNQHWNISFGIDNLNDYHYWNFHPYPGRSFVADIKYDI
jgi:iron complex outermembrane receptor protein